jgi:Fic family protein
MWFDLGVSASDDLSREELISLARMRAERIAEQDVQIVSMAARIAELTAANEALTAANEAVAARLARLEHLLSRNSSNSSSPPSKDDDPGRTPPVGTKKRGGPTGSRGK